MASVFCTLGLQLFSIGREEMDLEATSIIILLQYVAHSFWDHRGSATLISTSLSPWHVSRATNRPLNICGSFKVVF